MDAQDLVDSLRASLLHAQHINQQFRRRYPKEYSAVISSLPPQPLAGATEPAPASEGSNNAPSPGAPTEPGSREQGGEEPVPQNDGPELQNGEEKKSTDDEEKSNDGDDDDDDGEEEKSIGMEEEQAAKMFIDNRDMERDAFFKARIAHGIDDDKVFDLEPKVDCRRVVESAKESGAQGLLDAMRTYPEEEGVIRRALKELATISADEKVRHEVGYLGGVELIADVMKRYCSKSETICHAAVRILCRFFCALL